MISKLERHYDCFWGETCLNDSEYYKYHCRIRNQSYDPLHLPCAECKSFLDRDIVEDYVLQHADEIKGAN